MANPIIQPTLSFTRKNGKWHLVISLANRKTNKQTCLDVLPHLGDQAVINRLNVITEKAIMEYKLTKSVE